MVALMDLVVLVKPPVGHEQVEACESPQQESVVNWDQMVSWNVLRLHQETFP